MEGAGRIPSGRDLAFRDTTRDYVRQLRDRTDSARLPRGRKPGRRSRPVPAQAGGTRAQTREGHLPHRVAVLARRSAAGAGSEPTAVWPRLVWRPPSQRWSSKRSTRRPGTRAADADAEPATREGRRRAARSARSNAPSVDAAGDFAGEDQRALRVSGTARGRGPQCSYALLGMRAPFTGSYDPAGVSARAIGERRWRGVDRMDQRWHSCDRNRAPEMLTF